MTRRKHMTLARPAIDPGRRRLLAFLGYAAVAGLVGWKPARSGPPPRLSLHEAEFYLRHDASD